jgi:hypothetical protein
MAFMTYEEWREYKEMVMGDTPDWFDDPMESRRRFESYCDAFEGNCTAANPLDAAFAPRLPALPVAIPMPMAARAVPARSAPQRLWAVAFALILQLAVLTAPAFAAGDVVVNGNALSQQERATLEAIVGPLQDGSYWAHDNGDFGRKGSDKAVANLRDIMQRRLQAAQMQYQLQQQQALRQQLMAQMIQNALRQRQAAQGGYMYGNNFSSGERYANGSWSHYNGYSNYGVGGTANGCIYTPNWSNC